MDARFPVPIRGAIVLHAPALSGGGDIDVALEELDPWWPLRLTDARLCQCLWYDVTGWYWVVDRGGGTVALDTLVDPQGTGKYAFVPPGSGEKDGPAPPAVRAAYLALKRLRKGDRGPATWASIGKLAASDPDTVHRVLTTSLGASGTRLAAAALAGSPPNPREWARLRRLQQLRRWRGTAAPGLAAAIAARWLERIARPTGLFVVLTGPDGCGKSSVAERLPDACRGLFRRQLRFHWRPGLLPAPAALVGRGLRDPERPHAADPHGRLLSFLRLCYFWADFLLGGLFRVLPTKIRTGLVLAERGWWDMVVDPRRYRLSVPPRLISALGCLVPKPDLVLVLDAPGEVLVSRKQELPADELDRQRRAWLDPTIPEAEKVVLDATKPLEQVLADAREAIVAHLERRAVARLGAGWANLPGRAAPRWWLPRGPRAIALAGISVYQPVTLRGRLGWEAARALARVGGFRLLRRGEAPPREVRVRLAPHLPPRTTYAVMRANHAGRYVALLVDEDGRARAVAKVATTPEGEEALRREARAIAAWSGLLRPPVRAPRVLTVGDGVLLLEAVVFRPRLRPWLLRVAVARAVGALEREGICHGDFAPWNLLEEDGGFVLVDWESAGPVPAPAWDLCHWLVQAHALLGRPHRDELFAALEGRGPLGEAVHGYLEEAGVPLDDLPRLFREHVERTRGGLDLRTEDGARGLAAREALLRELSRLGGGVT
jgi:hypothetical protein